MKMEHYKVPTLLNDSTVSKFLTKKWAEVNDLSISQYSVKNIRFEISMLRSDLCDYSDAYIVVKENIDFLATAAADENDKAQKNVAFQNNAPYRSWISKINNV